MADKTLAFVGCLNREAPYLQGARGTGIATYSFDEATGALELLAEKAGIDNPNFLAVDTKRQCLYAISEVFGWNEGLVTAYRIDPARGELTYLNKQPTLGSITAYCSLDRTGRYLFVANYSMGAVTDLPGQQLAVFPLREDGSLGPVCCSRKHEGTGPVEERQEQPHAHCVLPTPDNRFVIVADLGTDSLVCYRFDAATGELAPADIPSYALPAGSGPRHMMFHPSGRFVYVINELSSSIAALRFDGASGSFELLQSVPALPERFSGESHCSDIQVSPDGRFLFGGNRGHDSVVVYAIDAEGEHLTLVGHYPSGGATPRNLGLAPDGRYLFVANQNGDRLSVMAVDPATGALSETNHSVAIGTPMSVEVVRLRA